MRGIYGLIVPSLSLVGADIDTLLVAPRHVERGDFFTSFKELLENTTSVSNIRVSCVNISNW